MNQGYLLSGLSDLGDLTLQMDKARYLVGEKPLYRVMGGPAGAQLAWTSYKDGKATGEYQAFYHQYTDSYGNATIAADQAWDPSHVGIWRKDVIVIPKNYPNEPLQNASVSFTVAPIPTEVPVDYANSSGSSSTGSGSSVGDSITNFFQGDIEIPVVGSVPKVGLFAVGGIVLVVALTSGGDGGSRRR